MMTSEKPTSSPSKEPPKKRRWLRRTIWTLTVLSILFIVINGIGSRKSAQYFLNKSLEEQGMTGTAEVTGSILSGFQLENLHYKGIKGIQSLDIDHLALDYKILELSDLKIDLVAARNVKAVIDIAKFETVEEEAPKEPTDWKQTLKDLRPIIKNPKISFEDLDITILDNGKQLLQWKWEALEHAAKTDEITLKKWVISDSNNLSTPEQTATITWLDGRLTTDQLKVIPELTLGAINFEWESELKGNASLQYRDALIALDIDKHIKLDLKEGELRSDDLFNTLASFGIKIDNLDTELELSKLSLKLPTNEIERPIPSWNLNGELAIKAAQWETYNIEETSIKFEQADAKYQLNIDGTALEAPLQIALNGNWEKPQSETWWGDTKPEIHFETQLNDRILTLIPATVNLPNEFIINRTKISGNATTQLIDSEPNNSHANIQVSGISVQDKNIPAIGITVFHHENKLQYKLRTTASSEVVIDGDLDLNEQTYQASYLSDTPLNESLWINALAKAFDAPLSLKDNLNIQWNGKGNLKSNTHQGNLTTKNLTIIQPEKAPVTLSLSSDYNWPNSFNIKHLNVNQEELSASTSLIWNGKKIRINDSEIKRNKELIAKIHGDIPFTRDIGSSQKFFAQTETWDIIINTEELRLKRMTDLLSPPEDLDIKGTLQTTLKISGSPSAPSINGNLDIDSVNDVFDIGLNNASLNTTLVTQDNKLIISGNVSEEDDNLIELDINVPFTPSIWLKEDQLIETLKQTAEIKGSAVIKRLPLNRITRFVPDLEKLEGLLDIKANFLGTVAKPEYQVEFLADLPLITLKATGVDDITDVKLTGAIDQNLILNSELDAKINGGKFTITTKLDVNDPENPAFDVNLLTDHALLYRDDALAMRANAQLNLAGNLENATLSGNIAILESLFYKDIDLIPIGVPSSSVETIDLPSIDASSSQKLPVPEPFNKWKLALTVTTKDPILIRGNIGTGSIDGTVKVSGTLAEPSLDGALNTKHVRAKLPFSILDIKQGQVIFKPNTGLIPTLDIRGKSQVGSHSVTLYAYGSANDPQLTLNSFPALPENEILTLLATGTTSSGLADKDVATFKTLQLLLQELKQRNDRPGGNRLFGKVLSGIDDLDLKVGEVNELTGEKFASATVELHRRWFLSAQIDDGKPPQTRGLIIFALRFR